MDYRSSLASFTLLPAPWGVRPLCEGACQGPPISSRSSAASDPAARRRSVRRVFKGARSFVLVRVKPGVYNPFSSWNLGGKGVQRAGISGTEREIGMAEMRKPNEGLGPRGPRQNMRQAGSQKHRPLPSAGGSPGFPARGTRRRGARSAGEPPKTVTTKGAGRGARP